MKYKIFRISVFLKVIYTVSTSMLCPLSVHSNLQLSNMLNCVLIFILRLIFCIEIIFSSSFYQSKLVSNDIETSVFNFVVSFKVFVAILLLINVTFESFLLQLEILILNFLSHSQPLNVQNLLTEISEIFMNCLVTPFPDL